jgi:hypothetical protein
MRVEMWGRILAIRGREVQWNSSEEAGLETTREKLECCTLNSSHTGKGLYGSDDPNLIYAPVATGF